MQHNDVISPSVRRNHWMNQVLTHAQRKPDETAFKYLGEVTTWAQAAANMDAFAAALARRGVGFGDRVLLLTLNRPEVVEAVFGINRIGAMAVPMNIRLSPAEIAYIIDDADGDVLIVEQPLAPLVAAAAQITDRITQVIVIGEAGEGQESYADLVAEGVGDVEFPDVPEQSVALIMYTSGTTGRPKGAMLDHLNMFQQSLTLLRVNKVWDDGDVALLTAPLFHIAGLGSIAPNFVAGIPTVMHPLGAFDPTALLDAYEAEGATIVFNVPQQWQAICAEPRVKERDLRLRIISWGAAPASEHVLRAMADCFPEATNVAVFGQTETSPITCALSGEDSLRKLGSVGRPIPTMQYRVVDPMGQDVPRGEVGEIVYRGPVLMQGYWRDPEATAEAFRDGWFHSGDLVREDEEGFIYVVDRAKDMIISGGENIYSSEVESAVAGHPDVLDVAVYRREDERWGEIPVAAVHLREGAQLTVEALSEWLSGRLASFKHPKDLVVLEELPRNAGGKLNKVLLREQDEEIAAEA